MGIVPQDSNIFEEVNKTSKIYLYGYTKQVNIEYVKRLMKRMGCQISGCILNLTREESIESRTKASLQDFLQTSKEVYIKLEEIEKNSVILCETQQKAEELENNCSEQYRIYTENNIYPTAVVNGKYRIVDDKKYYKSMPWYFELIYGGKVRDKAFQNEFPFIKSSFSNGRHIIFADSVGKYVNIIEGWRRTAEVDEPVRRLLFLGDSRIYGDGLCDEDTIPYVLSTRYSDEKVKVYNMASPAQTPTHCLNLLKEQKSVQLSAGDVVVCSTIQGYYGIFKEATSGSVESKANHILYAIKRMNEYCIENGWCFMFFISETLLDVKNPTMVEKFILDGEGLAYRENTVWNLVAEKARILNLPVYDLTHVHEVERVSFYYNPYHYSPEGALANANAIGKYLDPILKQKKEFDDISEKNILEFEGKIKKQMARCIESKELEEYCKKMREHYSGKDAGVIVMNANPFTKGHRHLVEFAKSNCDFLYVMVVEENRSYFSYDDRFEMVKRGCEDLENVAVIPSGKFVISQITFQEYFTKEDKNTLNIDASTDLYIFAEKIMPALGIRKRFVGQEYKDLVTQKYNQQMKDILSEKGFQVIEIERKKNVHEEYITATAIRKWIDEGNNLDSLKENLYETSYQYLVEKGRI